jgi:long-chain acyl-CoA synthetase
VFDLLEQSARGWGDRTATICFKGRYTFRELLDRSRQFGHALRALGVRRGDRIAVMLPNVSEYVIALCGAWMADATVVQFSPLLVEDEIEKLLDATGCRVAVTLDLLSRPLSGLIGRGPLRHLVVSTLAPHLPLLRRSLYSIELLRRGVWWNNGHADATIEFERLIAGQPTDALPVRIEPARDAALIQPTGGTTGNPKAVVLTHRNLLANTLQLRAWMNRQPGLDTILAVLPFFHCYGLTTAMLGGLALAGTLILCPRFQPELVADLIKQHRPTMLPGVPALYAAMNRHLDNHPVDLSSIELCVSGSAPLDSEIRGNFQRHGAKDVIEGYGLSESSPVTHVNPVPDGARGGTIGLPLPDTTARVVDLETGSREVPAGVRGELIVRGPQVMAGYLDDAAETARVLRDGWLYTGDIATMDADGFFRIVDRKKDLIKPSGFSVFPAEVEAVIRRFEPVLEVAVVGVPDPECGELVKAFIVPKRPQDVTIAAIEKHCRTHLAKHKQPRVIELCTELPRNFLGKVLRRQLRAGEAQGTCVA